MHGIISSIVLFFIPYGTMFHSVDASGKDAADLQSFGFAVATILVIVVNLQVNLSSNILILLTHGRLILSRLHFLNDF